MHAALPQQATSHLHVTTLGSDNIFQLRCRARSLNVPQTPRKGQRRPGSNIISPRRQVYTSVVIISIMDPMSAMALAATAARLAGLCVKVADGLHKIHTKQGRAADSLQSILRECKTLAAAAGGIESWAYTIDAQSDSRKRQCASLDEALKSLTPSIEILTQEVEQILNKMPNDGELPILARVRYLWKEEDMNMHLTELRWQANHIHLLITTINLCVEQTYLYLRAR